MLISLNWLNEFLSCPISFENANSFAEQLTLAGLEVTNVKAIRNIQGLVVGKILKKEKHPDADKLNITQVEYFLNADKKSKQIICGASNVVENRHVIVATIGTELGKDFTIKKAKIRGVESEGMICSKEEIGLENKSEGIWLLPENANIEHNIQKYIGEADILLEVVLTSNRYDCHSVQGIAKETATVLNCNYDCNYSSNNSSTKKQSKKNNDEIDINIKSLIEKKITDNGKENFQIQSDNCPEYSLTEINNVTVSSATEKIKNRLQDLEINSINNLVDIGNYLMLESGRPMHIFDADKVSGKLIIRQAMQGEKMVTIDGTELTLKENDLVIADEEKILCLAGIIGSNNSSVTEQTKNILLEVAEFDSHTIRNSTRYHKIFTTASSYFEKGCYQDALDVRNKTLEFIFKSCPDAKIINSYSINKKQDKKTITFYYENLKRILGIDIEKTKIIEIFKRLYFTEIQQKKNQVTMTIPKHRKDIQYENDLVEEIARIYGYDKIPSTFPKITNGDNSFLYSSHREKLISTVKFLGYHQVYNYSFLKENLLRKNQYDLEKNIVITSPINENFSLLRNSLLWGLLNTLALNLDRKNFFNKCFEIGKVFFQEQKKYIEKEKIGFLATSTMEQADWLNRERKVNFHHLSQDVQILLIEKGFSKINISSQKHEFFTDNSASVIKINAQEIGFMGKLKSSLLHSLDLDYSDIFYAEIDLTKINSFPKRQKKYSKTSIFPSIARDIALVFEESQEVGSFVEQIKKASSLITEVVIESIYRSEEIGKEKKSVAFKITIKSTKETLSKEEGDNVVNQVVEKLEKKNNFTLR